MIKPRSTLRWIWPRAGMPRPARLRVSASEHGLQAEVGGIRCTTSHEAVAIAEAGLKARARPGAGAGSDETHFLNALKESLRQAKWQMSCWTTTTGIGTAI